MALTQNPQQPDSQTPPPASADGGAGDANGGGTGATALTQEQVNELVGRTRAEARQRATTELLQQFGTESAEQLAERLKRLQELEQAQLSEQERVQAKLSELESKLAERDAAVAEAQAQMQRLRIEQAVQSAAVAANFRTPADALALIDISAVVFDDSGQPSGVAELVAALATERPYLVAEQSATGRTPRPARPAGATTTRGNGPSEASQKRPRLNF